LLSNVNLLDAITNLSAWIYKAISNRVIDLWRHDRVRAGAGETEVADETISQIVAAAGFDPSDLLVRKELSDALSEAIGALPEEQRTVIEAQVFDGLTFQDLAERTGLPVNTLMTRKRLAVKKLSLALKNWIADD
jgi:RNA polymerase sigma factor (sigma-70 family)